MRKTNPKQRHLTGTTLSVVAIAIATAFPMHAALAQATKSATDDAGKLETVIVTGQRRSENIKDVPLAISAIKGEALDAYNTSGQDIRFLANRVPSLNVESDFGRVFPRFYIRGLGNTDFDLNASQPVGLVYDDIVQENPILKGFPVFDVEQIEVLRGPQGTLFGRNSPAGIVKFESAKPSDKLEGYVNLGYGNYHATNIETAINVPLDKKWALRVSLQDQNRDNRVNNTRPTGTQELEGYHDAAARVQLQYKDTDFTALAGVHGRQLSGNATLFRANIIKKGTNDLVDGFRYQDYPTDGINTQTEKTYGANLRLRWDLSGVSLYSITGYDRGELYSRADVDGGYGASFALPTGPGVGVPFNAETADGVPNLKQFTQEFRAQSNTKDPLQWLAGLYYFKENLQVDSFDYNSLSGNVQDGYAVQHQDSKSYAAFGSLNYAVTDALKIRGGLRYTKDRKDFDAEKTGAQFVTHPKGNNTSWDFGANYTIDKDTSVYGRIATGYRAPSVQGRVLFGDDISVAKSETNVSYEVGIKQDLFDNKARFTATVFHFDTKDLQLTAGNGTVNQNQLLNAKKAVGQGVEVEIQANLNRNFKATLGASYNDTEIKDPNLVVQACGNRLNSPLGCTVLNQFVPRTANAVFINGNDLPRAPKVVANFSLRYNQQIGEGEIYAYTDWSYKGSYNFFLYQAAEYKAKPLLEGGLRVGYKWGDGKYEVAGYGRNITDQRKIVAAIDFNNLTGILNEPRAYGVQFKYNF
jgi:iron complex outermembrane receptor protein